MTPVLAIPGFPFTLPFYSRLFLNGSYFISKIPFIKPFGNFGANIESRAKHNFSSLGALTSTSTKVVGSFTIPGNVVKSISTCNSVIEKNAPRELKLCLALDFVRRCLEGHMIKEKGFVEKDLEENIKIPKFNSSDETGRFFLGVIEDIGQGIEDKVLDAVVLQAWSKKLFGDDGTDDISDEMIMKMWIGWSSFKMILMNELSKNALEELSAEKSSDDRIPHICNSP
ncbi:hypothetical protein CFP56_040534 [Quercus suber]|uniref:Uncharacterized protein n=1 Tax=Quercus suber TaxID=58331 RepID=A0AAW0LLZ3_QUESU